MKRMIRLLNEKNHYLEKFYSLNESAIMHFAGGDFTTLEEFYQTREDLIQIIQYLDQEVREVQNEADDLELESKTELREILAIKDEYVSRILAQDLEILACIEQEKSQIIRELQSLNVAKKAVGRYKSGAERTQVLDEEV